MMSAIDLKFQQKYILHFYFFKSSTYVLIDSPLFRGGGLVEPFWWEGFFLGVLFYFWVCSVYVA
jgi:hypothetical protein